MNEILGKLDILMTRREGWPFRVFLSVVGKKPNRAVRLVRAALELIPCCKSLHTLIF